MWKFLIKIPHCFVLLFFVAGGGIAGLGAYIIYISSVYTYATADSTAFINCHLISLYYSACVHSLYGHLSR